MSGGMCKNCANWSSTDQVWGHCTHIESDYPSADPKNRASINLCTYDGTADLWTREDFGCREWKSLRAALKRIANAERTSVTTVSTEQKQKPKSAGA